MAITIGSTSFSTLTAQPFGYEETDTRAGQTARKWTVTGLLKPSEWLSLLSTYDTWRNTRINDVPTESSEVIGTTVAFTGNGPGGQSWTGVACWFLAAPQGEQAGAYLSATIELVDANQALAVLLKAKEQEEGTFDYGPVTIGGASFPNLTAQPIGYEETNTRAGYTAKKWLITGVLTSGEWSSLLSAYNGWRNARIEDEPSEISGVVGTTISLSGTSTGSAACWFIGAPQAERDGADLTATIELVDAAQALEVLLKAKEDETAGEDLPDLGTITIGSTVLTLLKPVDAYATSPTMELTSTGTHIIQGALVPYKIKDVEGTTNSTGWTAIRAWYETQIGAVPSAGSYFPISSPTASAANRVVAGVTTVEYTVSIQLGLVL